jgi:GNAT superfamily N-acetyltransferase
MRIRDAHVEEHELLSRIALEAKVHWGYDAADLARWETDLIVSRDSLAQLPTFVAEVEGHIVGFFQLSFASEGPELEHFWVLPAHMGKGIGRALLAHALREVSTRGHGKLLIDADPNAEGFYVACGAVRTAERSASTLGQPHRVRPQLVLSANATQ